MRIRNKYSFRIALHLILLLLQLLFWNFTIDDAFISFKYAKNLFFNQEMVFNIGEAPVEGYSNFLWVIWMMLSFVFNVEIVLFSKVSGLIFCHLSVLILYRLAFRISKSKDLSYIINFFLCFNSKHSSMVSGRFGDFFILLSFTCISLLFYSRCIC